MYDVNTMFNMYCYTPSGRLSEYDKLLIYSELLIYYSTHE